MSTSSQPGGDAARALAALYDDAVPQVYGYLLPRCRDVTIAEDLTAESFLAAASAVGGGTVEVSIGWLIGIARHKLVDHWRRQERETRNVELLSSLPIVDDPWDEFIEMQRAHEVLSRLPAPQRAALVLRYLDDLPVAEVAELLGRSLRGTETLLVRSRAAFRRLYQEGEPT